MTVGDPTLCIVGGKENRQLEATIIVDTDSEFGEIVRILNVFIGCVYNGFVKGMYQNRV